jgi:hypothetical protein
MVTLGTEAAASTPEEFQKLIVDGVALTARIARKAGIEAEYASFTA